MRIALAPLAIAAIAAGLSAQTYTVSPEGLAGGEGVSNSAYPFTATSNRFQQTMTDWKGMPRTFKALNVRPDGPFACTTCIARTIEVQITMAHTDLTKLTTTFASNYIGTPTLVFPRQKVNLPARSATPTPPAKPDYFFLFTTPFNFDGKQDYLVDIQTYNNSATTADSYYSDYASTRYYAAERTIGTGCTAQGQTNPMTMDSYVSSELRNGSSAYRLRYYTNYGPASASCATLIGLTDPNASAPGLCATVHTDGLVAMPATSNASGYFQNLVNNSYVYVPYNPSYVGLKVYSQSVGLDAGSSSPIPVALSNGFEVELPGGFTKAARVQHFSDGDSLIGAGPYANQLVLVFIE